MTKEGGWKARHGEATAGSSEGRRGGWGSAIIWTIFTVGVGGGDGDCQEEWR